MASTTAPSLMDTLFQRTPEDLVKALRLNLITESKSIEEIKREIKSTDLYTKSIALRKLTYLSSLHSHDMAWAAFHAVEVISSSNFVQKKVGYLAISQSFDEQTPVFLLITNQMRKDLNSGNEYEVSLALECLMRIGTVDLARDLTPEVFTLLGTSKVFVKKKAISVVLRVFEKYPDAVHVCFKRLVDNLESSDPQIVSVVVGVFCELALRDPRSYLPLAPEFYKILVDCRNNWVLIKVLKIFAKLAPLEPRLAKRVVEPVSDHMRKTCAKSLLFECIRTVVSSFSEHESAVKLAVSKIKEFLVDDDPNLKYLGFHALSIAAPDHLWAVLNHKEFVIKSLSDEDPNIKLESLHLLMVMVSESNVAEICRVLVNYALKSDPEFCNEIIGSILSTCSRNVYDVIVDFDWYVSLLGEISRIPHCQKGEEIESQLIDIGMRVKDVRPQLVRVGRDLLIDPALLGNPFLHRILSAAAWVLGEYIEFARNPFELAEALLQPRTSLLPPSIRAIYILSTFKILVHCLHSYLLQSRQISSSCSDNLTSGLRGLISETELEDVSYLETAGASAHSKRDEGQTEFASSEDSSFKQESVVNLLNTIELALGSLSEGHDVELQERARNLLGFIDLINQKMFNRSSQEEGQSEMEKDEAFRLVEVICDTFLPELGPVSTTAQERVSIPDGLLLKRDLTDLDMIDGVAQLPSSNSFSFGNTCHVETVDVSSSNLQIREKSEPASESTSLLAEHRKRHGLYYLPSEKSETVSSDYPLANEANLNEDAEDLAKLTEHSLVHKKNSNHTKPRPVVVKLDEGEEIRVGVKKPKPKDDLLSGAVREILLSNENLSTSSHGIPSDKPSSKSKGKEKLNMDLSVQSKENMADAEKPDHGNSTSRRSKHRSRHRSPKKKDNAEKGEENGKKEKQKSSHRHGRHRTRQKADESLKVATQSAVIPDFLL